MASSKVAAPLLRSDRPPVNFVLPSKSSSAIKIVRPPEPTSTIVNSKGATQSKNPTVTQIRPTPEPAKQNGTPAALQPALPLRAQTARPAQSPAAIVIRPHPHTAQSSAAVIISRISADSTLDIYASNYVPEWLKAVNDSYAVVRPCLPLNSINFAEYIASFASQTYLWPPPIPVLPAPMKVPIRLPALEDLQLVTYKHFWYDRQQYEIGAQAQDLVTYRLYNIPTELGRPEHQLYRFTVTGLRENAPRIDLGDRVLVRPLVPVLSGSISQETSEWYSKSYGFKCGRPAPAFAGFEFHAVVWGLSRPREQILLRIDGLPQPPGACNLIFVIQDHNIAPLYRAIDIASAHMSKNSSWIQSMLFPEEKHATIQTSLSKGRFDLDWHDPNLNFEQKKAVSAIIDADYGTVPYLISGPPGTGKTKSIVETALQLLENDRLGVRPHLLICAPSEAAADTLTTRLSAHLKPTELFRLNGWTRTFAEVPDNLMLYSYAENDLFTLPIFSKMMSFKIVVTTCRDATLLVQAQLSNDALAYLAHKTLTAIAPSVAATSPNLIHWTALLLDEAAQATEPESLIPLAIIARTFPPVSIDQVDFQPQVIMAGDEHQLGPRLASRSSKTGLEVSLFQRLFERRFYASHPLSRALGSKPLTSKLLPLPRPAFTNLIRNYRSHPAILSTPSSLFYFDTLVPERTTISPDLIDWPRWTSSLKWPVLFKQNSASDAVEDVLAGDGTGGGSLTNAGEIEAALTLVISLFQHASSVRARLYHQYGIEDITENFPPLLHSDVIVMSPFSAQVAALRTRFRAAGYYGVSIGPLEAFQGLEARVVIICTTRTRLGALSSPSPSEAGSRGVDKFVLQDQAKSLGIIDEPKRFNVAVTRAKEGLIVIGDARTLTCTGDPAWKAFLGFCIRNGCAEDDGKGSLKSLGLDGDGDGDDFATKEGRLEKALKFAARNAETGSKSTLDQVRKMGMRMYDEEERMWLEGMTLPSEDEDEDYPEDEDAGEDEVDDSPAVTKTTVSEQRQSSTQSRRLGVRANTSAGAGLDPDPDFDRDLETEFKREGCATQ